MSALPQSSPETEQPDGTDRLVVSGRMSQKELKRITRRMRSSILGPTAIYYAGVTAPAISAGMATVVASVLERAGWAANWVLIVSGLVAAMAGISWYLIFMRLSYRHSFGRSTEGATETSFEADPLGLFWSRGDVKTRIGWSGVTGIYTHGSFIQLGIQDAGDVILPKSWFKNRKAMKAFAASITEVWEKYSETGQ